MAKATTPNTTITAANTMLAFVKPPYAYSHLPMLDAADVDTTTLMRTLHRALRSKRPNNTMAEARFAAWLAAECKATMIDTAGNIHVDMRLDATHRTMFTSHTDTVHREGGTNNIRIDKTDAGTFWRADEGQCLGADDGAGVALMAHMIEAGVPGYYIFFRGEECGGIGSTWLADNMKQLCKAFDRCVSFDRAGYSDVITHQGGSRCCSDAFATALADALINEDMTLAFSPNDTGVFTDSANLTHLIPECTNLSIGYKHQHGDGEWQNVSFLRILAAQLVQVQWGSLPTQRDPSVKEPDTHFGRWMTGVTGLEDQYSRGTGKGAFSNHDSALPLDDWEQELVDALTDATFGLHFSLHAALGEWLNPDDVAQGMKHIDVGRVERTEYERYANGIESGEFDATTVYEILIEDCYKE